MMMILFGVVAVIFVVFLVGGGIVLPLLGMIEDARDRRPALTPKPVRDVRGYEPAGKAAETEREKIAA